LLEARWKTPAHTETKTVSRETIRRALKNELKPWRVQEWCIPPEKNTEFVAAMGDIRMVIAKNMKGIFLALFSGVIFHASTKKLPVELVHSFKIVIYIVPINVIK
jgi:hypothetical protein